MQNIALKMSRILGGTLGFPQEKTKKNKHKHLDFLWVSLRFPLGFRGDKMSQILGGTLGLAIKSGDWPNSNLYYCRGDKMSPILGATLGLAVKIWPAP